MPEKASPNEWKFTAAPIAVLEIENEIDALLTAYQYAENENEKNEIGREISALQTALEYAKA